MLLMLKKYKLETSLLLLLIFYGVGLVGILYSEHSDAFSKLSWLNLLISGIVLFLNHKNWSKKLLLSLLLVGVLGFFIEVAGVRSGMIFGEYRYGDSLGYKWLGVPLIIGLNWTMLCYYSVFTLSNWVKQWYLVALLAATGITGLDIIMEPVAVKLGFWRWSGGVIPLQNFVAWFVIASIFNKLIMFTKGDGLNKLAPYLFIIQILFFVILRMAL